MLARSTFSARYGVYQAPRDYAHFQTEGRLHAVASFRPLGTSARSSCQTIREHEKRVQPVRRIAPWRDLWSDESSHSPNCRTHLSRASLGVPANRPHAEPKSLPNRRPAKPQAVCIYRDWMTTSSPPLRGDPIKDLGCLSGVSPPVSSSSALLIIARSPTTQTPRTRWSSQTASKSSASLGAFSGGSAVSNPHTEVRLAAAMSKSAQGSERTKENT